MEWLKRLSSAIAYIENNLDGEISYEEAARIACCSPYYFGRMFSYAAGISLSDYVRRRKMTQAAFLLQSTDSKVLDIALKFGYASPTAFNRAFQSVHGLPPIAARKQGCRLNAYPPLRFKISVSGEEPMTYRIEEKEPMQIVGVRIPITEKMEETHKTVPTFWAQILQSDIYSRICSLSNQKPCGILGLTVYEKPGEIFYYIGVSTDREVPEGMLACSIPAAAWAVFENEGSFQMSVQSVFKRFLTEWLPFSGYTYAELPDLEVYPFSDNPSRIGHTEVWIAVKKEKEEKTWNTK